MRQEHSTAHAHHAAPSCSQGAAQGVIHGETLLHCSSLNSFASGQDPWNAPVFVLNPGWQLAKGFSPFALSLPSVSFSLGHKQAPNPIVSSSIFSGVLPSWASHRHTSPCSFSPSSSASSQLLYFPYQCGRHAVLHNSVQGSKGCLSQNSLRVSWQLCRTDPGSSLVTAMQGQVLKLSCLSW